MRLRLLPVALLATAAFAQTSPEGPPRSGLLFVSPMGEPFREEGGAARWFERVDADHDGILSRNEFIADAARFFATLDTNGDQRIGPTEIDRYEIEIVPETNAATGGVAGLPEGRRPGDRMRRDGPPGGGPPGAGGAKAGYQYRASGAGRFGYLATPEPVTAADADLDRSISSQEFVAAAGRRFVLLDANEDGTIRAKELPKLRQPPRRRPPKGEVEVSDR